MATQTGANPAFLGEGGEGSLQEGRGVKLVNVKEAGAAGRGNGMCKGTEAGTSASRMMAVGAYSAGPGSGGESLNLPALESS